MMAAALRMALVAALRYAEAGGDADVLCEGMKRAARHGRGASRRRCRVHVLVRGPIGAAAPAPNFNETALRTLAARMVQP